MNVLHFIILGIAKRVVFFILSRILQAVKTNFVCYLYFYMQKNYKLRDVFICSVKITLKILIKTKGVKMFRKNLYIQLMDKFLPIQEESDKRLEKYIQNGSQGLMTPDWIKLRIKELAYAKAIDSLRNTHLSDNNLCDMNNPFYIKYQKTIENKASQLLN